MIFRWGKKSRSLLLTLILGLAGGACSSSSESQQETIEADESQEGASEDQDSAEEALNQAAGDNAVLANAQVNEASEQGLASLIDDVSNANAEQEDTTQAEEPLLAEEPAAEAPMQNAEMATPLTNETALSEVAAPEQTEAPAATEAAAPQMTSMPGLPEMGAKLAYIVEKGDTLAKISEKVYGNANMWKELASLAGISNPNKIYPGEVIYYQLSAESSNFAANYESLGRSAITVVKGDTLAKISAKVYGTSSKWRAIWRENEQVQDPESLTEGGVIYYVNYPSLSAKKSNLEASKDLTKVSVNSDELNNEVFEWDFFENETEKGIHSAVSMKSSPVSVTDKV